MWQALLPLASELIDRVLPDPEAAAAAKLRALEMAQRGELAELDASVRLAVAQIETNRADAQSSDNFQRRWRPAAGWVCVFGLAYQFLVQPLLPWIVAAFGVSVPQLPPIDGEALMVLLTGMLGLSGMRSFERVKGKA